jgi:hypothetical protein
LSSTFGNRDKVSFTDLLTFGGQGINFWVMLC